VPGLSVRDVEPALAEALGHEAALSKWTVSRICQQVKTAVRCLDAASPAVADGVLSLSAPDEPSLAA
jgi:hypothetical protein